MHVKKFKSLLVLHGDNYRSLGNLLGLERRTIESKLQSKSTFSFKQIKVIKEHYNLTKDEVYEIFFTDEINNSINK